MRLFHQEQKESPHCFVGIASIHPYLKLNMADIALRGALDEEFKSASYFQVRCVVADNIEDVRQEARKLAKKESDIFLFEMKVSKENLPSLLEKGQFSSGIARAMNFNKESLEIKPSPSYKQ